MRMKQRTFLAVLFLTVSLAPALQAEDRSLALRTSRGLIQEAADLAAVGMSEQALPLYNELVRRNERDVAALNGRGRILFNLKRYEEAVTDYTHAIDLITSGADTGGVELAHVLHRRGYTLEQMGRLDQALADVEEALRIEPKYLNAIHSRGLILLDLKRDQEAQAALEQALEVDPAYLLAAVNLVYVAMDRTHNYKLAAEVCAGWRGEGAVVEADKAANPAAAAPVLSRKIPVDLSPAKFYRNCSSAYKDLGRFEEQDEFLRLSASAVVDGAIDTLTRGESREDIGEMEGALADYQEAIIKDPMLFQAYESSAALLMRQGRFEEAKNTYEDLLKRNPDSAAGKKGAASAAAFMGLAERIASPRVQARPTAAVTRATISVRSAETAKQQQTHNEKNGPPLGEFTQAGYEAGQSLADRLERFWRMEIVLPQPSQSGG